jgi:hypothetical protein
MEQYPPFLQMKKQQYISKNMYHYLCENWKMFMNESDIIKKLSADLTKKNNKLYEKKINQNYDTNNKIYNANNEIYIAYNEICEKIKKIENIANKFINVHNECILKINNLIMYIKKYPNKLSEYYSTEELKILNESINNDEKIKNLYLKNNIKFPQIDIKIINLHAVEIIHVIESNVFNLIENIVNNINELSKYEKYLKIIEIDNNFNIIQSGGQILNETNIKLNSIISTLTDLEKTLLSNNLENIKNIGIEKNPTTILEKLNLKISDNKIFKNFDVNLNESFNKNKIVDNILDTFMMSYNDLISIKSIDFEMKIIEKITNKISTLKKNNLEISSFRHSKINLFDDKKNYSENDIFFEDFSKEKNTIEHINDITQKLNKNIHKKTMSYDVIQDRKSVV